MTSGGGVQDSSPLAPLPAQVQVGAPRPAAPPAAKAPAKAKRAAGGDDDYYSYSDDYSYYSEASPTGKPAASKAPAAALPKPPPPAATVATAPPARSVGGGHASDSEVMELSQSEYYSDEEPAAKPPQPPQPQPPQPTRSIGAASSNQYYDTTPATSMAPPANATAPPPVAPPPEAGASAATWMQQDQRDEAMGDAEYDDYEYDVNTGPPPAPAPPPVALVPPARAASGGSSSTAAAGAPGAKSRVLERRGSDASLAAPADVTAYLASRPDGAAFRQSQREDAAARIGTMERGATLIKFNAGKGMFGKRSDASRMVERWVVLETKLGGPNTELGWGDPKTRKLSSQVRLSECKRVLYGQKSEVMQSITFNPHPAWLCFSIETHSGRTFDFAAPSEGEAHTWVCGLSALIGSEIDHGWLLWKTLEMKMTEDLSVHGLPGMVKRVAQRLQRLEGNPEKLEREREEARRTIVGDIDNAPPPHSAAAPPSQPPPSQATAAAVPLAAEVPEVPLPPKPPLPPPGEPRELDDDQYTDAGYSEFSGYEDKVLAYEEKMLNYEESLLDIEERLAGAAGSSSAAAPPR